MKEIELRLQEENPKFRKLWLGYSHNKNYRVVITLFPEGHGDYKMIFGEPKDLTYESINGILQKYLVSIL